MQKLVAFCGSGIPQLYMLTHQINFHAENANDLKL